MSNSVSGLNNGVSISTFDSSKEPRITKKTREKRCKIEEYLSLSGTALREYAAWSDLVKSGLDTTNIEHLQACDTFCLGGKFAMNYLMKHPQTLDKIHNSSAEIFYATLSKELSISAYFEENQAEEENFMTGFSEVIKAVLPDYLQDKKNARVQRLREIGANPKLSKEIRRKFAHQFNVSPNVLNTITPSELGELIARKYYNDLGKKIPTETREHSVVAKEKYDLDQYILTRPDFLITKKNLSEKLKEWRDAFNSVLTSIQSEEEATVDEIIARIDTESGPKKCPKRKKNKGKVVKQERLTQQPEKATKVTVEERPKALDPVIAPRIKSAKPSKEKAKKTIDTFLKILESISGKSKEESVLIRANLEGMLKKIQEKCDKAQEFITAAQERNAEAYELEKLNANKVKANSLLGACHEAYEQYRKEQEGISQEEVAEGEVEKQIQRLMSERNISKIEAERVLVEITISRRLEENGRLRKYFKSQRT